MSLFVYFIIVYLVNINCNGDVINTTPPTTDANYYRTHYDIVRGTTVNIVVGPATVSYCKLVSPRGSVFYNDFSRCRLSLDRISMEHHGNWEMHVGYPGQATFDVENLIINVIERAPKTKVHTVVEESYPNTTKVSCSLPIGYGVRGCRFRGPNNLILLASGTTEKIAKINKMSSRFESRLDGTECSVRILNPEVKDLGFWRCDMYTEHDTYYGFVTVLSSWLLNESSVVETIRQGPLLRLDHRDIEAYKGEPVTMSCSIDAPIRYCYFWMSDGTIFNVNPDLESSSMEYVGSGFEAGECGLKLHDLNYTTSKRWSCNVALATGGQQSHYFLVGIHDRMEVSQEDLGDEILISSRIANELEYCRFVQEGGFGFSYDNTPSGYKFEGSLDKGLCKLVKIYPNVQSDYDPWTIVVKVKGEDEEISGTTKGLAFPIWHPQNDGPNGWQIFGWVMLGVAVVGILLGVLLVPQRNRTWMANLRRQRSPLYIPTS